MGLSVKLENQDATQLLAGCRFLGKALGQGLTLIDKNDMLG